MGIAKEPGQINAQEIHEILRNDRRRMALERLRERVEPMSVRELSELIAELEADESPPPRGVRESVYNSLHQTHLPKLDRKGVVEYDEGGKTVHLRRSARQVTIYLEVVTPYGITWSEYYRALAVVGMLSIVAVEVGVPVLSGVAPLLLASGFLAVVVLSTVYQAWSRRWFYLRLLRSGEGEVEVTGG